MIELERSELPVVLAYVELSTSHLQEADNLAFSRLANDNDAFVVEHSFGYWLHFNEEWDERLREYGVSAEAVENLRCIERLDTDHKMRVDGVKLDRDGPVIEKLHRWQW